MTALYIAKNVSFYLPHPVAGSVFIICRDCVLVLICCECAGKAQNLLGALA